MPLPLALPPAPPALTAPAPLTSLAWLEGTWRGAGEGTRFEEHWSRGLSGFQGMFRMERGAVSVFLEAMVLEPEGADHLLRIRHFGPGLRVAWEDKERPVVFRLASASDREARFEGTGPWTGETLRYLRTGSAGLDVILEKVVDGLPKRSTFRFTRVP